MNNTYRNVMELTFSSLSENEAFARITVAAFVSQLDPSLDELNDIKTVVSEAVTNAIIHGYEEHPEEQVYIRAEILGTKITIQITDKGIGIDDIGKARQPLFTSKPELERSGMGFTIMENFMDEVTIRSNLGQGTTVLLVKQLKNHPQTMAN
ncbi:anti-sigma F factor [Shimazuella kribbensis]|uniref:anti-sigma F factor n=1 Tax=Shimazuella kribbensis TaxID=139808 RepID=UPI000410F69A|nr:anti-sigma F factor [Shimazuella kribbensis]